MRHAVRALVLIQVMAATIAISLPSGIAQASDGIVSWGAWPVSVPDAISNLTTVAAGGAHSLGLKADGSIVAWGDNSSGECTVPSPNTGFMGVAAGAGHSLGLKADGSIVAWGDNDFGQCIAPGPNAGFVAVAAGDDRSFGIRRTAPTSVPSTNPIKFNLPQNFPNPFNPLTTIRFDLPESGPVRLAIYDVAGRLLRVLVGGEMAAGSHEAVWNGRDAAGRGMASGSYFARLQVDRKLQTVRMSIVR